MIVNWLAWIILIAVNVALLPYFLFVLIVSLAAFRPRRAPGGSADPVSKFLVVIPAHDEEPVISTVVKSCLELEYPRSLFQVVVIADNCSDRTGSLARGAGARVIDRFDDRKKSKGYAIDYLIEALKQSGEMESTDALVIIDADSTVDPKLLRAFDRELTSGHDWIQAYYTVSNPNESWRTRLLTYAFSLFNGVMPLGKSRLGLGASFTGNGMCFSVKGLNRVPWQSHGLVEDMEYSWALRIAGEKILFLPEVSVHGAMLAGSGAPAASQRLRWEFGRKEIRKRFLGPLLSSSRLGLLEKLFLLCELTIPALGTLAVLYAGIALADVLVLAGQPSLPVPFIRPFLFGCLGFMTTTLVFHAMTPFLKMRLPWRYGLSVFLFPVYLIWKFWVTSGGRPDRWVRTPRESRKCASAQLADRSP